jgi:trimeric autotransporter adhesin
MNPLIEFKTATPLFLIVLLLACIALLPAAQAVVPAPDGGYPGFNTAEGQNALFNLTTGVGNTAMGWYSLWSDTDGSFNTAIGAGALLANIGDPTAQFGDQNTATGAGALLSNTTGFANTATGAFALFTNTTGNWNTANGDAALNSNTIGTENTANGHQALHLNTTGSNNTAIGTVALNYNSTGSNNVALGAGAGLNVTTANNVICIGAEVLGVNLSDSCFIGNIFGAGVSTGNVPVYVDAGGKLGTGLCSRRFKENIKPMERASEILFALKPVTFRYKEKFDSTGASQFGLVAEDVEKVNPALIVRDKEGKPYTVRYEQVNAMLLNEFLKEHCKVEKLEATVAQQRKDFEAAVAQVTAQVQKVSAQLAATSPSRGGLEVSRFATGRIRRGGPAPQVVSNP